MANESANSVETSNATENGEVSVTLVDGVCVVTTGDVATSLTAPIVIEKPDVGETAEIQTVPGQKYFFDFNENNVDAFVQDGENLILNFADGSAIILQGFGAAADGILPVTLAFSDALSADQLASLIQNPQITPDQDDLEEPQAEVRQEEVADVSGEGEVGEQIAAIEPAAGDEPSAEDIAAIEPAAGEDGGAGEGGNTGFGFQSNFEAQGVITIDDVGPIGPTSLRFDLPQLPEDVAELELDSIPVVTAVEVSLDETGLDGPLVETGVVPVDFGDDGPGMVMADGNFSVEGSLLNDALSSGGQPVEVVETSTGYIGTLPDGSTVFEFVLDPSGAFEFTQNLPLDHADGSNPNDVISFNFGVKAVDADGDITPTTVTVNVLDDAPAAIDPDENTFDESALANGPVVINDTLDVDFGNDVGGMIMPIPNSPPVVNGVADLASNGQAITITATANGYIGTLPDGSTAFELTLDPQSGDYTFTQNVSLDHDADNDTISLVFGVKAVDFDGDIASTTITVNINDSVPVFNDRPVIGDGLQRVDESNLPGESVTGQLTVDLGVDGPGVVMENGDFSSSGSQLNGTLTSGGETVSVDVVNGQYVGTTPNGDTIFTLDVRADGSYTFDLLGVLDHADPDNPNDIINLSFGVKVTDSDGDVDETTIVIQVLDDAPVIGDVFGDVDETGFDNGPISVTDTILTNFGLEADTILPNGDVGAQVNGVDIALTSGGNPVTFVQTADGYEGTINGGTETVFTVTVDPQTGEYVYTQFGPFDHPDGTDPNDLIELTFGVGVTSTDGDSDTGTITISVADDGPVAVDDLNGAEEGQDITGSVVANDDLSNDVGNTVTQVEFGGTTFTIPAGGSVDVPTSLGILTLNSDGTYGFDAADAGSPDGVVTFTYTLVDFDGDSDTAVLSIQVTPDGEPLVVSGENVVDETALNNGALVINESLAVDFGADGIGSINPNGTASFGGSTAGGALTSNDVPVEIVQTATGYVGVLQGTTTQVFELTVQDNGDYSFELFGPLDHADGGDPNDTITLNFGVTASDNGGDSAGATITVHVLDDAPIANDDLNNFNFNDGSTSGNVITGQNGGAGAADDLSQDNAAAESADHDVTQVSFGGNVVDVPEGGSATIAGNNGVLEISDDGSYTYTLNPGIETTTTTVNTFTPTAADTAGNASSITQNGITITGVNGVEVDGVTPNNDLTTFRGGVGVGDRNVFFNEALRIDFAPAENVLVTIGDIGANNLTGGLDFTVTLSDGSTRQIEVNVEGRIVNEQVEVVFDSSQFGGLEITRIEVTSDETNSALEEVSFTLESVTTTSVSDIDSVRDEFEYVIRDGDGDTSTATLSLDGSVDDVPTILNVRALVVDETDFNPTDSDASTIFADFGDDAPGTFTATGAGTFDFSGATNNTLTSNGVPVDVAVEGNNYVGRADGAEVFRLSLNETTGQYEFVLSGTLDHADATNPNDVIELEFGVTATDDNGDSDTGTILVQVLDDGPQAAAVRGNASNETALENGPIVITNTLGGDHGEDGAGTFGYAFNGTIMPTGNLTNGQLSSGGVPVTVEITGFDIDFQLDNPNANLASAGSMITGTTADGEIIFTVSLNTQTGEYTYTQFGPLDHADVSETGLDDVIWLKFGVDLIDFDGDTDSTFIQIDVRDDGPLAADDTDTVGRNETTETGNVLTNDEFGADGAGQLLTTGTFTGANGTLVLNADGSYIYTRNGPNSGGTDRFDYTIQDNDGDTSTATLSIDVVADNTPIDVFGVGATDDSLLANGTEVENGIINVDYQGDGAGSTTGTGGFSASGNLEGGTLSHEGIAVNVSYNAGTSTYTGTAGNVTVFTAQINANGTYSFRQFETLDHSNTNSANEALNLTFGVRATDADGDSGVGTLTIVVRDDGVDANNDTLATRRYAGDTQTLNVLANDNLSEDGPNTIIDADIASGGREFTLGQFDTFVNARNFRGNGHSLGTKQDLLDKIASVEAEGGTFEGLIATTVTGSQPGGNEGLPYAGAYAVFNLGDELEIFTLASNWHLESSISIRYTVQDGDGDTDTATLTVSTFTTPLVLDLDGDGIELLSVQEGVIFDIDADGQAERTGWVGADDGLLALDRNGDGIINDQSELFGDGLDATDGFDNLASYDSNGDGVIDASDDVYSELLVWQDLNSDGISDAGELLTLDQIGIVSISLTTEVPDDLVIEGNVIALTGTFTTADGETHQIVDALFQRESVDGDLYATNGAVDTFFFETSTEGFDTIHDFNGAEGDILDVSALLEGFDPLQDSIDEFVFSTETDEGDTVISIDSAGGGDIANATQIVVLDSVTGLDLGQLINNGETTV